MSLGQILAGIGFAGLLLLVFSVFWRKAPRKATGTKVLSGCREAPIPITMTALREPILKSEGEVMGRTWIGIMCLGVGILLLCDGILGVVSSASPNRRIFAAA